VIRRLPAFVAAAAALAAARAWIVLVPGSAVRWASSARDVSAIAPTSGGARLVDAVARAVAAVGSQPIVRATCLEQGIALVLLLSIARIPARLVVGVSRDGVLRAHAWVESGGVIVLGGAPAPEFAPLPPPSPTSCPG
jgi:transglutaminase-like putative cysteine protease